MMENESGQGGGRQELINAAMLIVALVLASAAAVYLMTVMPGTSLKSELPLMDGELVSLSQRLREHVWTLAEEIGERHYGEMKNLNRAADYIYSQFQSYGYVPLEDRFGAKEYRNITVNLYGREKRNEVIVVGAHYDTVWLTPGADDNASGVAGLLEIARVLSGRHFARTIRFIAFTNEEEPFYGTANMGSGVSAKHSYESRENIVGMFSLEMIGFYSSEPRSQYYPGVIRHFYPKRGNFIAFVSNFSSRGFLRRAILHFRNQAAFPSEGLAAPERLVPDIRRSDNASYWYYGFPAVMITDTSNYRNQNYHNVGDVPRTLDYDSMARVVSGLTGMLQDLARD